MKVTTFIFPHIPKCGGSSLRQQFSASDKKVFFDYDHPPSEKKFYSQECLRRNQEFDRLDFSPFDIVFGHFPVERYAKSSYQYLTILRHPLDRAVSHFFYWKNLLPDRNQRALAKNPIIAQIKSGEVGFYDFLVKKEIDKFYLRYLGGKKPDDFTLVGFADQYDRFCDSASELLGLKINPDIHLRKGMKEKIKDSELKKARELLCPEIEMFKAFQSYWRIK